MPEEGKDLFCVFWWHARGIFGILLPQHLGKSKVVRKMEDESLINPGRIFVSEWRTKAGTEIKAHARKC